MKLVAISGSPHGMKGATAQLLNCLLDGASEAGADVQIFLLGELSLAPCRACDVCHKTGTCAIPDDFHAVREAIMGAQAVVLASPNYMRSVTAQMKALLDRCCGPVHLQAFEGKYGAAVVSSGGGESEEVAAYMLRFLRSTGCWTVGSVGAEARVLFDDSAKSAALDKARALGARLVQAAREGETFPEQASEREAFAERMRQLVMSRKDDWPYEYEHWQSRSRL